MSSKVLQDKNESMASLDGLDLTKHTKTLSPSQFFSEVRSRVIDIVQRFMQALDAIMLVISGTMLGHIYGHDMFLQALFSTFVSSFWMIRNDYYKISVLHALKGQALILVLACTVWCFAGLIISLLLPVHDQVPIQVISFAAAIGLTLLAGLRCILAPLLRSWERNGWLDRRIAVVGLNHFSKSLIETLRQHRSSNIRITGAYRTAADAERVTHAGLLVRGDIATLLQHSRERRFDLIVLAFSSGYKKNVCEVYENLAGCTCAISVVVNVDGLYSNNIHIQHLSGGWALAVSPPCLSGWQAFQKAMLDRSLAFILFLLILPILLLLALAIKADTSGAVLFRQPRVGFGQKPFMMLKFRSMRSEFEDLHAAQQTLRNDPRITRVGRWLRRFSLDELPQLWNVIAGDMSLVGPRPHALGTKAGTKVLDDVTSAYAERYRVKPGITGWAQINQCRGAIHTEEQLLRRLRYDIDYIQNWSIMLDLKILMLTAVHGFSGPDVY